MIKINGVEYGLFWSVWAHCRFDDWLMRNKLSSYSAAVVKQALIANEAYRMTEAGKGTPELTEGAIMQLPNSEYVTLQKAVEEQIAADSAVTIEKEEAAEKARTAPTGPINVAVVALLRLPDRNVKAGGALDSLRGDAGLTLLPFRLSGHGGAGRKT